MSQDIPSARICFVIPTYDEALNITLLLRRLTELYSDTNVSFLIVDDESPDGTARLVREFMAEGDSRVHLLQGRRRGLGDAYIRGMTHALDTLGAEVVVQMDADFSHDPADAGRLLAQIANGADVVIGSRYVSGGALDEQWHVWRRFLSRSANLLARWIGGLKEVYDCTAGFKAIRAETLRAARVADIRVQGYVFQPVLLSRLVRSGAMVVEEPIYFRDREYGQTKFDLGSLLGVFRDIWLLHVGSPYWTIVKFALTGLSGVFVNLGSFHLMLEFGLHKFLASPLAILLSILSNFLVNNYWTFSDRVVLGRLSVRGVKYIFASLVALALSYTIFVVLSVLFPRVTPLLLQACGIPPGAILNYLLNSRWIFREEDYLRQAG